MTLETPSGRSYWVVPEKLLAGYYPGDLNPDLTYTKIEAIFNCGIRSIINLMEEDEVDNDGYEFRPYLKEFENIAAIHGSEVHWMRFPIRDMEIPSHALMVDILNRIDSEISQSYPVYVHCWGGVGRTGTVVGCYLARHGIASGNKVIKYIQQLRKDTINAHWDSPQTDDQRGMVAGWKKGD